MSEKTMRREFVKLVPNLDPVNIENLLTGRTGTGTPDVDTIAGYVELKQLDGFPARETTVVRIPHFTDEQRNWHQRRYEAGELTWLVVQCRQEWFVFRSEQLPKVGTEWTRSDWKYAAGYFTKKPSAKEMQLVLLKGWAWYTKHKISEVLALLTLTD